jgi:uncharacterized protein
VSSFRSVNDEIELIIVGPDDWSAADAEDQRQYESAARDRGITLVKAGGNARDVLAVVRPGSQMHSIEQVLYNCVVLCPRRAWEHQLRLLLDLDDPCFFWASLRRSPEQATPYDDSSSPNSEPSIGHVRVDTDSDNCVGRVAELSEEECLALLATQAVGRIVFVDPHGQPMALPVNYVLHDRTVAFRSDAGAKLTGVARHAVAFEIDGIDPLYHEGWSVVVTGTGEDITEAMDPWSRQVRAQGLGPWAAGDRSHWIVIANPSFSGRRIRNG